MTSRTARPRKATRLSTFLRWGIRRIEALLADGPPGGEPSSVTNLDVRAEDLPELEQAWGPKACEFQLREPRRLICTASFADDPSAIGRQGLRFVAPTSEHLCSACEMPDAQVLCAHLINPEVIGIVSDSGVVARRVIGAMCELGQPEISQPRDCRVGGHRCCERVVEARVASEAALPALSLMTTIDYVDASWRASSLSGRQDLFKHRRAAVLADLAQPGTSCAEFFNRVLRVGCRSQDHRGAERRRLIYEGNQGRWAAGTTEGVSRLPPFGVRGHGGGGRGSAGRFR